MTLTLTPDAGAEAAVNVVERTSPSGLSYWHVADSTVPLVAMRFGFRGAGATQDTDGLEGTATLAAAVLDEGAGPHDALAFQTLLEDNAIRLSFDASQDNLTGELTVVADTVELGAELLSLALTQPRFDEDAIERARGQIMAGLRRELNDPEAIASRLSSETFFPDHPYARPSRGSLESLPTISTGDLRAYHQRALGRDRLHIAIVGDIDADGADALVDAAFAGVAEASSLTTVSRIDVPAGTVRHQDLDVAQTVIRFAMPGIDRDDPDFMAAFVMNHIVGGGTFSSRLFKSVREERGLTYSVYSYLAVRDHAPFIGGGASTRPERAQETLDVIRDVLSTFVAEGPSEEELQAAKDFLIGSYPLRFDSSQKISQQLVGMQLEDMPISYMAERAALIRAITVDDIRRVAARLLNAPLSLVIVGQPLT
ncbi:MAG: insulinase family protein [Devosiaceae bacterium]|nr:insulinase family protein [Devosiaceae bacterium MH13]